MGLVNKIRYSWRRNLAILSGSLDIKKILSDFIDDGCLVHATALAFTTLFSIVPLLVLVFSMFSSFSFFDAGEAKIRELILNNIFVEGMHDKVNELADNFIKQASSAGFISIISLGVIAIFLLVSIEHSLNTIWKLEKHRSLANKLVVYWSTITIAPILIGLSVYLTSFFKFESNWFNAHVLPFLLSWFAFYLLYKLIPNTNVSTRAGIAGAFLTAVLWQVFKVFFGLYLSNFATYQDIYGSLWVVPVFLLWLDLTWLVVLFGAEVAYNLQVTLFPMLQDRTRVDLVSQPNLAFSYLEVLYGLSFAAQQGNEPVSLQELKARFHHPRDRLKAILGHLEASGLIIRRHGGASYNPSYLILRSVEKKDFLSILQTLDPTWKKLKNLQNLRPTPITQIEDRLRRYFTNEAKNLTIQGLIAESKSPTLADTSPEIKATLSPKDLALPGS